jgi:hypothetical protein
MRFQFRLRTTLLFIVAASVALAAMRSASPAWASAIVTATVLALLVSIALAMGSRGDRRLFWIGFAVYGTGYFAVVMTPFPQQIAESLATTIAVRFLDDTIHPPTPPYQPRKPPNESEWRSYNNLFIDWTVRAEKFVLIGQCIWALILATLGGVFVRLIAGRGTGKPGDPPSSGS